jgi:hypothetical protein
LLILLFQELVRIFLLNIANESFIL